MAQPSSTTKEIYGIPGSGWSSPSWNWGYGVGTGHDCAAICRRKYGSKSSRGELLRQLLLGVVDDSSNNSDDVLNFEEVKLILGLAWQNGRWSGKDGGEGGYSEVLQRMADAQRYEVGPDCEALFVKDMAERYHLLKPDVADAQEMKGCCEADQNVQVSKLKCAGLVLKSMGFLEDGL